MKNLWMAEYNSTNFDFISFGSSETESIEFLKKGLEKHASQYRLSPNWYYEESIRTVEIISGHVFRDGQRMEIV